MGLREINAERTKRMIVESAMELFLAHGYDGTTMEQTAIHAGVGSSTLYRYFPTKASIALGVLGDAGRLAEALRGRPAQEAVEVALGHALLDFVSVTAQNPDNGTRLRRLLEDSPRAGARIMGWFGDMHARLEVALTERLDGPGADLQAGAMAWTAIFVLQRCTEDARRDGEQRDIVTIAQQIMADLADRPFATPRL